MAGPGPEGALRVIAVKFRRRHAGMKRSVPPPALSILPCRLLLLAKQYKFSFGVLASASFLPYTTKPTATSRSGRDMESKLMAPCADSPWRI